MINQEQGSMSVGALLAGARGRQRLLDNALLAIDEADGVEGLRTILPALRPHGALRTLPPRMHGWRHRARGRCAKQRALQRLLQCLW